VFRHIGTNYQGTSENETMKGNSNQNRSLLHSSYNGAVLNENCTVYSSLLVCDIFYKKECVWPELL
jgi:hypothetical protein